MTRSPCFGGQSAAGLFHFRDPRTNESTVNFRLAIRAVTIARDPQAPRQTANDGSGLRDESLYAFL